MTVDITIVRGRNNNKTCLKTERKQKDIALCHE